MQLTGTITRIIANKGDWASIVFQLPDWTTIRAVGTIVGAEPDLVMELTGEYVDDPKWGRQFKVTSSKLQISTKEQVIDYLSSSYIKGIGRVIASRIYDMFGSESIDIVENHPEKLAAVKGMSAKKAVEASESVRENRAFLNLLEYLGGRATAHQIRKLHEKYGSSVFDVLKKNPYVVIYDLEGFGFKKADGLAQAAGISLDDPRRVKAAITFTINTMATDGHCYCKVDELQAKMNDIVPDVPLEKIGNYVIEEINADRLVLEDDRLYTRELYIAEQRCADSCAELIKTSGKSAISQRTIDSAIQEMELETGFTLEKKQKEAIFSACKHRLTVITGGPGTGKTTIIKAIVRAAETTRTVILAAPTGKASRRMAEVTGKVASTIHRMLIWEKMREYKDDLRNNRKDTKKRTPFFVIDEASMLDIKLAHSLLRTIIQTNGSVVFIGDVDQLPPVGPGNFLRDLLTTSSVPKVKLELCHRQKGLIAVNADRINRGLGSSALSYDDSFAFIEMDDANEVQEEMIRRYIESLKTYDIKDVCLLSPIRKKGRPIAVETLNEIIREIVNPYAQGDPELMGFREGDRVMETQNDSNRDVYNGDCGVVWEIDEDSKSLIILLDDGRMVEYGHLDVGTLTFAYAMTIHKSQGSEFKEVILCNTMQHYIMLQRNLLYTGVTRAREKVIVIGSKKAINIAVQTSRAIERNTYLRQKIIERTLH